MSFLQFSLQVCVLIFVFLFCWTPYAVLSLAGISSVILGFVISIGLASVLGYPYTLVHAILPFLCLGMALTTCSSSCSASTTSSMFACSSFHLSTILTDAPLYIWLTSIS